MNYDRCKNCGRDLGWVFWAGGFCTTQCRTRYFVKVALLAVIAVAAVMFLFR